MNSTLRTHPITGAVLDHPFPDGFCQTLAATHQWSALHASLVLTEYRRFLVLAASGPAAPSRHVTMAHDLHRSVAPDDWQTLLDLAGDRLRSAWDLRGESVYTDTLDRYRVTFGHPAPANVWHDPRVTPGRTLNRRLTRKARTLISVALAGVLVLIAANSVLPAGAAILLGFVLLSLMWKLPQRQGSASERLGMQGYSASALSTSAILYAYGVGDSVSCGDGGGGSC